jgi:hypothetical protein
VRLSQHPQRPEPVRADRDDPPGGIRRLRGAIQLPENLRELRPGLPVERSRVHGRLEVLPGPARVAVRPADRGQSPPTEDVAGMLRQELPEPQLRALPVPGLREDAQLRDLRVDLGEPGDARLLDPAPGQTPAPDGQLRLRREEHPTRVPRSTGESLRDRRGIAQEPPRDPDAAERAVDAGEIHEGPDPLLVRGLRVDPDVRETAEERERLLRSAALPMRPGEHQGDPRGRGTTSVRPDQVVSDLDEAPLVEGAPSLGRPIVPLRAADRQKDEQHGEDVLRRSHASTVPHPGDPTQAGQVPRFITRMRGSVISSIAYRTPSRPSPESFTPP